MFLKKSRYRNAHPFDPVDNFAGVRPREIHSADGVIEHVIKSGDRLDLLARHYYNDGRLWWRILDANQDILFGGDLCLPEHIGATILIPRARE